MNGSYFGTGALAAYRLDLYQEGREIHGEILECDAPAIAFEGQTDGGDFGFGEAEDVRDGRWGPFQLRWTPQGVIVETTLAGQAYYGQFGHDQAFDVCGTGGGFGGEDDGGDEEAGGGEQQEDFDTGQEQQAGQQQEDSDAGQEQQAGQQDDQADTGAQPQGGGQENQPEGGPLPNF